MLSKASDDQSEEKLSEALLSFKCVKDTDIETFLGHKALEFLARGWCSVFLLLNEEEFDQGNLKVEAYFTLSHKVLVFQDCISGTKRKKIADFKDSQQIQCVLIGHLGKYINLIGEDQYEQSSICAKEIIDQAFDLIREAHDLIPCKCVLVECSDEPKVHEVYLQNKFEKFQHDGEHLQMIRLI